MESSAFETIGRRRKDLRREQLFVPFDSFGHAFRESYQKERLYWGLIDSLVNWLVTGYRKEAQSKRAPARAITNIERDRLLKIQREVLSNVKTDPHFISSG